MHLLIRIHIGVQGALAGLLVLITLFTPLSGRAGVAEDCAAADPNLAIVGCSLIIETVPTPQVDTAMAYSNRGRAYMLLGELDKALGDFNDAVRLDPGFASAYSLRGNVQLALRHSEPALADYTRAIELDPSTAGHYYNRGNLYLGLEQIELGISDLSIAIKFDPKHAGAYCNRGLGYILAGEREKGIADLRRALDINPNHEIARRNLHALGID
jgi:tetratricopeptide (TPR) repeat protein